MSLIGEALKRARQEAAYQEAAREGRTWGPPPAYPAPKAKTWPLLAAGVAAGALLVAALAGGLYWMLGRDARQAEQVAAQAEAPAAPGEGREDAAAELAGEAGPEGRAGGVVAPGGEGSGPHRGAAPGGAERGPGATAAGAPDGERSRRDAAALPAEADRVAGRDTGRTRERGGATGSPETAPPARTPAAPTVREAAPPQAGNPAPDAPAAGDAGTGAAAATEPRPAAPPAPAPAPRREEAAPAGEPQTYVGEAPLPGGGKLELTGIADSTDQPVALINGRVMGPGETIEGYTLVRIGEGQVELRGHGATMFLRLR